MTTMDVNFSKIVRSLLLDMDICMDQLEQIGYFSREQRKFMDRFLYKSEDALRAANLTSGNGGDFLLTKLPSSEESSSSGLTPSPLKSENGVNSVTSRVLPRLRSVTEQFKPEENGLTTFLKRCNARNFSVQVKRVEVAKESTTKGKASEYISTLESIAENTTKAGTRNADTRIGDSKFFEDVNHDTEMMLRGVKTLTHNMSAESVDYEMTSPTDAVSILSQDKIELAIDDAVEIEPANTDNVYTKAININARNVESITTQPAVEPIRVELTAVEATELNHAQSQPSSDEVTKIELVHAGITNDHEKNQNNKQWNNATGLQKPAVTTTEEVETNAWGKPIKNDPTRNKEGSIVGASAKPLGAENKGRAMMEKMGWSRGTGLGKEKSGILEPIAHVVKNTKTGLRSSDERNRKSARKSSSSENTPKPTPVDDKSLDLGVTVIDSSDWGTATENVDWEKSAEMTAEQIQSAADWAAAEKHAEKLNKAEAAIIKPKAAFNGITALYLRASENGGPEKTIKFSTKIQGTNEFRSTSHYPGVVVRALSSQPTNYSSNPKYPHQKSDFKVSYGHNLEILRLHNGNDYHVYNFSKRMRGIVKISMVEMMEEPEA